MTVLNISVSESRREMGGGGGRTEKKKSGQKTMAHATVFCKSSNSEIKAKRSHSP